MRAYFIIILAATYAHGYKIPGNRGIGAVVSNGHECGPIGVRVLRDGGNAFDAAIAVLLCEGVTGSQNMGIGGGFLATIYVKKHRNVKTLNAREAAPGNSSAEMFKGLPEIKGGHASGVPSEIKGYWELKQKFGSKIYSWQQIFQHSIDLCQNGYKIDSFMARILKAYEERILITESLSEIFVNKNTGKVYEEGDTATRPKLAETLRNISIGGVDEFYGGVTGQNFLDDVKSMGGILTMEDLINYKVIWGSTIHNRLTNDLTLHTVPIPGSGVVLSLILDLVKNRIEAMDEADRAHWMIEAFKHAYGQRSQLADSNYEDGVIRTVVKLSTKSFKQSLIKNIFDDHTSNDAAFYGGIFDHKDHGTSNIAVIDSDGNAITVTSTINNVFGAFVRSQKTGIILNDEMDDFSTPGMKNSYGFDPSPINFIKPGKRPMSSMSPTIVLNKDGNVRLLIGAAGGSQITTSVALTIIQHILLGEPLEEAIDAKRFHHQLLPMAVQFEKGYSNKDIVENLIKKGHEVMELSSIRGFNAVTGISVIDGEVTPVFDHRRGGSAVTTRDRV